jgi:hypothetical protein
MPRTVPAKHSVQVAFLGSGLLWIVVLIFLGLFLLTTKRQD